MKERAKNGDVIKASRRRYARYGVYVAQGYSPVWRNCEYFAA